MKGYLLSGMTEQYDGNSCWNEHHGDSHIKIFLDKLKANEICNKANELIKSIERIQCMRPDNLKGGFLGENTAKAIEKTIHDQIERELQIPVYDGYQVDEVDIE